MIKTFSIFYYDYIVSTDSQYINFDEGSGELTATVNTGSYAPSELPTEIETALNAAGTLTYSVSFDRDSREFTISAGSNFDLLINTGSQSSSSIFPVIGFTGGADLTGQSSYTGGTSGDFYEPQFKLQDYVDPENNQTGINASINESTTGEIEAVTFGTRKIIEANIRYITDIPQDGKVIKNNPTGVADARRFFEYITKKRKFEFMPDIDNRSSFNIVILESMQGSGQGIGFKFRERLGDDLPDYYDTGVFEMRVIS